ncbi:hypothetical protein VPHK469_0199 [Vibrio phage K469]
MSLGLRITLTASDKPNMNLLMNYLNDKFKVECDVALGKFTPIKNESMYVGDWVVYPSDVSAIMMVIDTEVLSSPMRDTDRRLFDECITCDTQYSLEPPLQGHAITFNDVIDVLSYTQVRSTNMQSEMVALMSRVEGIEYRQKIVDRTLRVINQTLSELGGRLQWLLTMVGINNWPKIFKQIANEISDLGGSDIDLEPTKKPTKH